MDIHGSVHEAGGWMKIQTSLGVSYLCQGKWIERNVDVVVEYLTDHTDVKFLSPVNILAGGIIVGTPFAEEVDV